MNCLFYVHSHTTFLSALGVIKSQNISSERVIFITTRHYRIDSTDVSFNKLINFSEEFNLLINNKYNFSLVARLVKYIDTSIENQIGSKYIAFLPHIGVFLMQIIACNKLCYEVNFIEEGTACYSSKLQVVGSTIKNTIKNLLSKLLYPGKKVWLTDYLFHDLYEKLNISSTYGISKETFKCLPYKKKIIQWEEQFNEIFIDQKFPIFIFDALIEMAHVEKLTYLSAIEKLVLETSKKNNYLKFHPYQTVENKKTIIEFFDKRNLNIIELDNSFPIEKILLSNNKYLFVGFSSSILFYAKLYNHNVITYDKVLLIDKKYRKYRRLYNFEIGG